MNVDAAMRELARRAAARATVEDVTRALSSEGIRSVVLKGAALVLDVYPEDVERPLSDVDVLVAPSSFPRAVASLLRTGYAQAFPAPHAWSSTLVGSASPLHVDLHGMLYSRGLFAMPADAILIRSVRIEGLDVDVFRPHGLDLVAHAVGHFAKSRPPPDVRVLGRDIAYAIARDALTTGAVATHLVEAGLARAAWYSLPRVTEPGPRDHARAILDALPNDPLASMLVALARRLEDASLESLPSVLSRHVLNASLARGAVSFGYQAIDAVGRKTRARLSRRP